ncbi:hypothetical protein L1987_19495 [Smallanthus sonchifolius]|uniref:Uncharacterized protein n=1 Tax=Smallanthus sonchifolius TaxID=185202 RepID=A0ACB9IS77_9ASTR|nr:hypothetical protein L1987_19495 [Smallanthus sonchifolius]
MDVGRRFYPNCDGSNVDSRRHRFVGLGDLEVDPRRRLQPHPKAFHRKDVVIISEGRSTVQVLNLVTPSSSPPPFSAQFSLKYFHRPWCDGMSGHGLTYRDEMKFGCFMNEFCVLAEGKKGNKLFVGQLVGEEEVGVLSTEGSRKESIERIGWRRWTDRRLEGG